MPPPSPPGRFLISQLLHHFFPTRKKKSVFILIYSSPAQKGKFPAITTLHMKHTETMSTLQHAQCNSSSDSKNSYLTYTIMIRCCKKQNNRTALRTWSTKRFDCNVKTPARFNQLSLYKQQYCAQRQHLLEFPAKKLQYQHQPARDY